MTTQTPSEVIAAGAGVRKIKYVVLHSEGDGVNSDTSAAAIRAYHMLPVAKYDANKKLIKGTGGNGWRDIGYNFWIRMNGLVELGRSLAQMPSHVAGFNRHSIGIGCAGDGNIRDFTLAQYDSLFDLCWELQSKFHVPWEHFIGHREVTRFGAPDPHKTCPGKLVDMDRFRALLAEPR